MNKGPSDQCPSCRNAKWEIDNIAAKILGLIDKYKVIYCRQCGLRKLSPQLQDDELEELYGQGYFNAAVASTTPDQIALPTRDYLSEVAPERRGKFQKSLDELRRLFPKAVHFLDVGAAAGDMVYLAKNSGLKAEGIEFSEFAIQSAKELYDLDLKQLALSELDGEGVYDLIHLNHVFEHFNDPIAELRHLNRLLKPGGGLYIEIPFQFHFIEKLKYRLHSTVNQFSLESIHHPYFYIPANIKRMLSSNGFRIIKCSVYEKGRYPRDSLIRKVKSGLWWVLSLFSIGNHIEIIAARETDRP